MIDEYWKDPRLDDEGTYDYLVEELPQDKAKWYFDIFKSRCDTCGKERRLVFNSSHYFYCYDGWDSNDYTECWKCMLKAYFYTKKNKIKREVKTIMETIKYCIERRSFKEIKFVYKLIKGAIV